MLTQTCNSCAFRVDGYCRRYAPSAGKLWPQVSSNDWCGEWKEAKQYLDECAVCQQLKAEERKKPC